MMMQKKSLKESWEHWWTTNSNFASKMPVQVHHDVSGRTYLGAWFIKHLVRIGFECGWRAASRKPAKKAKRRAKR